ncbi:hypothetical protein PHYSODRAFT_340683 [Phytophthora sojae]|uniref:Uncharacterized protein n=1 Tax=Phytophthora sojae (strain P6497) TaxID=1094619 RepID=G5AAJ2_PHYSP|nr:hypothetical protein PHYSODRAFT_340683 [Phytophthora sojae]EGZ07621.1 hypothetical protein PHYSODRAFT_340683 [Phytophthora sojae]|eukprot:XP_009537187.1 hypothetical protein PHYSODRAFT_340683 [Phytophthora sojae]
MVQLLTKTKTRYDNSLAFTEAVSVCDLKKTKLLVKKNSPSVIATALFDSPTDCSAILEVLVEHSDQETIQRALKQDKFDKQPRVLRLLLAKCDPEADDAELVELLRDVCDVSSVAFAMETAAFVDQTPMIGLLRDKCDTRGKRNAAARAKAAGHDGIVQLLKSKRARVK